MNDPSALQVLFEDNHLLGVLKPAGLLSQSDGSGAPDLLSLAKAYVKKKYAKPGEVYLGLVHRLDRNVGGVMILARTSKAAGRLSRAFRDHDLRKFYTALVEGRPSPPAGERRDLLVKDEARRMARAVAPGGGAPADAREARLGYRLLRHGRSAAHFEGRCSLLEIELFTGRFHQIRAQLAAMGHPILGDEKYGARPGANHRELFLFASRLELVHPVRREPLVLEARPPFLDALA